MLPRRKLAKQALEQVEVLLKAGDALNAAQQEKAAKLRILGRSEGRDARAWQMFYRHQEK